MIRPAEVVAVMNGCPGAEHLAWILAGWSAGATPIDPGEVAEHADPWFRPEEGQPWPPFLMEVARSPQAVVEVLGWRTSIFGDQVTTYRAADGRDYDLVSRVDPVLGRIADFRTMRSSGGADIGAKPVAELEATEWAALRDCFSPAFRGADLGQLDRRLAGLRTIGLAWRGERLLGFSAVGFRRADLPVIGNRSFLDCGITCVDPTAREAGISNAVGTIAMQHNPPELVNEFALLFFATPVMLRGAFRFGRASWPGTTVAEVAAALANPTPTQRAVGHAIADLYGASGYDPDYWVVRAAEPFGDSSVDLHDLEAEYDQLFRHVDRSAGDTLLGMFWWDDPPAAWWT